MATWKFVQFFGQNFRTICRNGGKFKILQRFSSTANKSRKSVTNGPGLKDFLIAGTNLPATSNLDSIVNESLIPYLLPTDYSGHQRKVYFEVYGCQMNVSDTEIVWSILKAQDYQKVDNIQEADVVLVITCAIREGAESKVCTYLKIGKVSSK